MDKPTIDEQERHTRGTCLSESPFQYQERPVLFDHLNTVAGKTDSFREGTEEILC